jgi:hypothetical protein
LIFQHRFFISLNQFLTSIIPNESLFLICFCLVHKFPFFLTKI